MDNMFKKLLDESKENYLKKSKNFNEKTSVLLVNEQEIEEIKKFAKDNSLNFDIIYTKCDIVSIEALIEKYKNQVHYFITNGVVSNKIYNCFVENGVIEENIYVGPTRNSYVDLYDKRDVIYENIDKINEVYNSLEDSKSKRIFLRIITRLCLPYQFHYYYEYEDFPQYYPEDFKFSEEEVYLDAGTCDGQNVFEFLEAVNGKYKYIYAFEADSNNYKLCKDKLKKINNLELINGALYSEHGYLSFLSSTKTGKKGNAHVFPDGDEKIESFSGDDLKFSPTYIKMDIEGSEKNALLGLQKTIKETSPKLAICIYHFQKDFWEVPLLIKQINPDYKLKIRNHENMYCLLESVCYAYRG